MKSQNEVFHKDVGNDSLTKNAFSELVYNRRLFNDGSYNDDCSKKIRLLYDCFSIDFIFMEPPRYTAARSRLLHLTNRAVRRKHHFYPSLILWFNLSSLEVLKKTGNSRYSEAKIPLTVYSISCTHYHRLLILKLKNSNTILDDWSLKRHS